MFVGTASSFGIKMSDIPQKWGLLEGYISYKWSSFCRSILSLEYYKTKKTERNSANEKQNWEKDFAWFIYTSSCIALTINNSMKTSILTSLMILLISGFKLQFLFI